MDLGIARVASIEKRYPIEKADIYLSSTVGGTDPSEESRSNIYLKIRWDSNPTLGKEVCLIT